MCLKLACTFRLFGKYVEHRTYVYALKSAVRFSRPRPKVRMTYLRALGKDTYYQCPLKWVGRFSAEYRRLHSYYPVMLWFRSICEFIQLGNLYACLVIRSSDWRVPRILPRGDLRSRPSSRLQQRRQKVTWSKVRRRLTFQSRFESWEMEFLHSTWAPHRPCRDNINDSSVTDTSPHNHPNPSIPTRPHRSWIGMA